MNVRQISAMLLCLLVVFGASGCASISARNEKPMKRTLYYPGIYRDSDRIKKIVAESKKPAEKPAKEDEKPASPKMALIWLPVPIIDMPFSLVWDTLALPFDYWDRDAINVGIGADAYK